MKYHRENVNFIVHKLVEIIIVKLAIMYLKW